MQKEKAPLRFGLLLTDILGQILAFQFFGLRNVRLFFLSEVVEQLTDAGVLRAGGGFLVEAAGFQFHYADLLANPFQVDGLKHPQRFALDKSANFLAPDVGDVLAKLLLVKLDETAAMI